jgi:uncharacterized protein (TIGR00255 family)
MNSMTGYGRGEASGAGVTVTVELRSVNNRFRDLQLRTPREYNALAPRINSVLKRGFSRGRIDVYVRRVCHEGAVGVQGDRGLIRTYLATIRDLLQGAEDITTKVSADFLLGLPGVLQTVEEDANVTAEWSIVEAALEAAAGDLQAMRAREGDELRSDLLRNLEALDGLRQRIDLEADGVAERLEQKLMGRLRRMEMDGFDPQRLAQEVALIADKADVSEELARMCSHYKQFRAALDAKEPVGRRLEFLTQELNREINTVGSKSVDHPVSALVVDMKSALEKLREQVSNVE